jgi:hypothetical protein
MEITHQNKVCGAWSESSESSESSQIKVFKEFVWWDFFDFRSRSSKVDFYKPVKKNHIHRLHEIEVFSCDSLSTPFNENGVTINTSSNIVDFVIEIK